jgi:hypothetical protein
MKTPDFYVSNEQNSRDELNPTLTMLQAVELPAGVANLTAGLPDVDGDALALKCKVQESLMQIHNFTAIHCERGAKVKGTSGFKLN